jgi:hypothetical protein
MPRSIQTAHDGAPTRASPADGGVKPARMLSIIDLPQPDRRQPQIARRDIKIDRQQPYRCPSASNDGSHAEGGLAVGVKPRSFAHQLWRRSTQRKTASNSAEHADGDHADQHEIGLNFMPLELDSRGRSAGDGFPPR